MMSQYQTNSHAGVVSQQRQAAPAQVVVNAQMAEAMHSHMAAAAQSKGNDVSAMFARQVADAIKPQRQDSKGAPEAVQVC